MNPLKKYFSSFNNRVPLTYYLVSNEKSRKNKNVEYKKSINSVEHNSGFFMLNKFHKPISRVI